MLSVLLNKTFPSFPIFSCYNVLFCRTAKTLALQRMDCILKWDEVSDVKPHPLNFLFVARDLDQDLDMEVVYWRDQMCFVKVR